MSMAVQLASIALARGAKPEELDAIWDTLKNWSAPLRPSDAVRDVERAIALVRADAEAQS